MSIKSVILFFLLCVLVSCKNQNSTVIKSGKNFDSVIDSINSPVNAKGYKTVNLAYKKVNQIEPGDFSIFLAILFPDPDNTFPGYIHNYSTFDSGLEHDSLPQYYVQETERRMREQNVRDDYTQVFKYVVIKKDSVFEVRKTGTYIKYIYSEGCDIDRYAVVKDSSTEGELFFVFETGKLKQEIKAPFVEIKSSGGDFLKPNQRFIVNRYNIDYTAMLCENSFSYDGFEASGPVYFNVKLKIADKKKEQVIFQRPFFRGIGEIVSLILTDINGDRKDDIILKLTDELCLYRFLYLSGSGEEMFQYMGYSKECDCP